jgi:hypothetical protein
MKRLLILAAAAAVVVTATPASAKKKVRAHQGYYSHTYAPVGFWNGYPAPITATGYPSAAGLSRASGRCVEDLGYGRYKYCGW